VQIGGVLVAAEPLPELAAGFGVGRHGTAQAGQEVQREAGPRLAKGAGAFAHAARAGQREERLDLTHPFPARTIGLQHLVEEAKEGAAHGVNLLAAVGALVTLGQAPRGQERGKEQVQVREALLAQGVDAFTQGGEPGPELREKGRGHDTVYILCLLTARIKWRA